MHAGPRGRIEHGPAQRPPAHPTRSRWVLLGIGLLGAGLAVLGYVAWEFWGTTWVSHRHRDQTLAQLRSGWRGSTGEGVRTRFGVADAIVQIPDFGPDYAVPVLEGTGSDVLATGFGHFVGTAGPGDVGNYVLAAHRVTHGEPLRRMPELRPGSVIKVVTRSRTYVYRLLTSGSALVVPMTASWVTTPLPRNPDGGVEPPQAAGERLITLTTCAELFHTDNRLVAFGVLDHVDRHRPGRA